MPSEIKSPGAEKRRKRDSEIARLEAIIAEREERGPLEGKKPKSNSNPIEASNSAKSAPQLQGQNSAPVLVSGDHHNPPNLLLPKKEPKLENLNQIRDEEDRDYLPAESEQSDPLRAKSTEILDRIRNSKQKHVVVRELLDDVTKLFDSDTIKNLSKESDNNVKVMQKRVEYLKNLGPNYGSYLVDKVPNNKIADVREGYEVPSFTAYLNSLGIYIDDLLEIEREFLSVFNLLYRAIPDFLCFQLLQVSPKSTVSRIAGSLRDNYGIVVIPKMHSQICKRCDDFWRETHYTPTRARPILADYYEVLTVVEQAQNDVIICIGNRLGNVKTGEDNNRFKLKRTLDGAGAIATLLISWELKPSENKIRGWAGGSITLNPGHFPPQSQACLRAIEDMVNSKKIFVTANSFRKKFNRLIRQRNPEWFTAEGGKSGATDDITLDEDIDNSDSLAAVRKTVTDHSWRRTFALMMRLFSGPPYKGRYLGKLNSHAAWNFSSTRIDDYSEDWKEYTHADLPKKKSKKKSAKESKNSKDASELKSSDELLTLAGIFKPIEHLKW